MLPYSAATLRQLVRASLTVALLWLQLGCGSAMTLTVEPREATPAELLPAPQLSQLEYRKVLLLPSEKPVVFKDVEQAIVRERDARYYLRKLEKVLLAQGFEVISSEVVARAHGGKKMTAAEKAMLLGKQTRADAVFVIQSISVRGMARDFLVDYVQTAEIDAGQVKPDEDGIYFDVQSERCVHRLPYYEISFEGKLLDSRKGTVLWVGSGRQSSIDVIQDNWTAEVDDDCEVLDQNFVYADYQADETTFDNTVTTLLKRLVQPLARDAFSGMKITDPKPPPKPVATPPPPPPPEPEKTFAIVSSKSASLRHGPGPRHKRKMRVPRKTKVEVLETMGEWIKVKVQDGSEGWMHESTVIVQE